MKKTLWEKRMPTIVGLFLILLAIGATTLLTQYGRAIFTRAGPSEVPKNVRITNVSDSSFTVAWETSSPTSGLVKVGETAATEKAVLDDRNLISGATTPFRTHFSIVTGLKPATKYYFRILSGQSTFDNGGAPYSVTTTASLLREDGKEVSISGSVVSLEGKPISGLVLLVISGAQPVSTLIKDSGGYLIPLSSFRTVDLASFYRPSSEDLVELTIVGEDGRTSKVRTFFKNSSEIPSITLGKDYDFTASPPTPSVTLLSSPSSSFTSPKSQKMEGEPTIASPKKGEVFTDTKPLFKGTAPSGTKVTITIESPDPIEATVTAGGDGTWTYQPKTVLSPGAHTITIRVPDQNGILRVITQTFTVLAQGSQVVEAATPSASPMLTISPTATPSSTPTILPSPTIVIVSPTVQPIPQSATVFPSILLGTFGILLSLLGLSLLVVKR